MQEEEPARMGERRRNKTNEEEEISENELEMEAIRK
jgi:hypothetical protein